MNFSFSRIGKKDVDAKFSFPLLHTCPPFATTAGDRSYYATTG